MPLMNLICHIAIVQAKSFRFARCEFGLICWHCKMSETKSYYTSQSQDDFDRKKTKPKLNSLFDLDIISSSTQNNNERKKGNLNDALVFCFVSLSIIIEILSFASTLKMNLHSFLAN